METEGVEAGKKTFSVSQYTYVSTTNRYACTSIHTHSEDRQVDRRCMYVCTCVHTSVVESDDRTTSVSCVAKGALCCCSAGDTREQTSRSTASGLNVHSLRSSLNDSFLQDTYVRMHTYVCTVH